MGQPVKSKCSRSLLSLHQGLEQVQPERIPRLGLQELISPFTQYRSGKASATHSFTLASSSDSSKKSLLIDSSSYLANIRKIHGKK